MQILSILCEQFKEDVTVTATGHKLLPAYIRVIQGRLLAGFDLSAPLLTQDLSSACRIPR